MYEFIRESAIKVRKEHRCAWCEEIIPIGETSHYRVYVWEGEFNSEYQHPECYSAMLKSPPDLVEEGWMPGMFIRGTSNLTPEYTLITTNLLSGDLPPRIASRLGDKAVSNVITIDAEDYRLKEREEA